MEEPKNTTEENVEVQPDETVEKTDNTNVEPPSDTSSDASSSPDEKGKVKVKTSQFTPLHTDGGVYQNQGNIGRLSDLELPVAVELGRVGMLVKDILELGPGAVVELNKFSGEPVDVYVNNKKFAEGEVVVIEQNFGVRILALVGPDERLGNLQ